MQKEQQLQFISVDRLPKRQSEENMLLPRTAVNVPIRAGRSRRKQKGAQCGILFLCALLLLLIVLGLSQLAPAVWRLFGRSERAAEISRQQELMEAGGDAYPQELMKMLETNEETLSFVEGYGERSKWIGGDIDLSGEIQEGQVPLLLQWDRRWGYDAFGSGMIGWAGCGPVCMTMAYLYLTDDMSMDPRKMAEFADQNGYHSDSGTSWDFWTSGAGQLGLRGEELSLSDHTIRSALDAGGVVVCSMSPGDFTTTGHYILIRGYDEKGFYVNDPNRRSNSEKQWTYDTLEGQIKNLWGIYRG
ncbi:MAG: C39 family peptidase [Lachnospiraceae bacterium]|nr:C39 family peptidase [Lachnospiraceae bacterium]